MRLQQKYSSWPCLPGVPRRIPTQESEDVCAGSCSLQSSLSWGVIALQGQGRAVLCPPGPWLGTLISQGTPSHPIDTSWHRSHLRVCKATTCYMSWPSRVGCRKSGVVKSRNAWDLLGQTWFRHLNGLVKGMRNQKTTLNIPHDLQILFPLPASVLPPVKWRRNRMIPKSASSSLSSDQRGTSNRMCSFFL